jgi:hypothetical protein
MESHSYVEVHTIVMDILGLCIDVNKHTTNTRKCLIFLLLLSATFTVLFSFYNGIHFCTEVIYFLKHAIIYNSLIITLCAFQETYISWYCWNEASN